MTAAVGSICLPAWAADALNLPVDEGVVGQYLAAEDRTGFPRRIGRCTAIWDYGRGTSCGTQALRPQLSSPAPWTRACVCCCAGYLYLKPDASALSRSAAGRTEHRFAAAAATGAVTDACQRLRDSKRTDPAVRAPTNSAFCRPVETTARSWTPARDRRAPCCSHCHPPRWTCL